MFFAFLLLQSFIGVQLVRILLNNTVQSPTYSRANALHKPVIGPILCVCYTNHALDQILEHLLETGVSTEEVVRIGGRSTNPKIQACALAEKRHTFHVDS